MHVLSLNLMYDPPPFQFPLFKLLFSQAAPQVVVDSGLKVFLFINIELMMIL